MPRTIQENISILPIDVTLLICEYVDKADLRQCIRVSIGWNTIFRPALYQTVNTYSYSGFCSFYRTIEKSTKKQKQKGNIPKMADLGCCVRTLHLQDGFMTVNRMQKLAGLCPNVTSVSYEWTESSFDNYTGSPGTRVLGSPVPFFERFHPSTLRSLSLELRCPVRYQHDFTPQTLFSILQHMPQLESITLSNRMGFVTIAFMEELHDTCPRLKQLTIPGENIKCINDETVPMDTIKTVAPARAMESLSMYKISGVVRVPPVFADADALAGPWFTYIVQKYPSLKYLALPSARCNLSSQSAQARSSQSVPAVTFRDFFPQLDELILPDFANQPSTAWPRLVKGIRKVRLCDNPAPYFSEWISSEATKNVERLSMSCFPSDLNELKHCPQLQELELDGRTIEPKTTMMLSSTCNIDIGIILSCCPTLKKLRVSKGNICNDGDHTSRVTKSSLRTLILHDTVIKSNDLLQHIGQRCPKLVHLDFHDCMWIIPRKYPIIKIDLSQHRLSYFRTSGCMAYCEDPAAYFGDKEPIAWNILLMPKTLDWDENNPQLFNAGVDQANFLKPFMRQIRGPAIGRWLDAGMNDDLEDDIQISEEAMEAIASFKGIASCLKELHASLSGGASEEYGRAGTVLCCHSIDRLYFGDARCNLEPCSSSQNK